MALAVMAAALAPGAALARTIELNCFDMTGFAVITPEAPLIGWAGLGTPMTGQRAGNFSSSGIDLMVNRTMLVRFDLGNIPKDMRITSAELVVPITYQPVREVRFYIYRLTASWGPGVCHLYRYRRPEQVAWTEPSARGAGADRALMPTARIEVTKPEETIRINVTSDVELWHSGAAENHGWLFCVQDQGQWIRFASPIYSGRDGWRLRITYEPR